MIKNKLRLKAWEISDEKGGRVFLLDQQEDRNSSIILTDDEETLVETIGSMAAGEFRCRPDSDKPGVYYSR